MDAPGGRLLVVAAVLLAGCTAPTAPDEPWPADPPRDRLGWEDGYWHNESLPVTPGDGLNASERRAATARAMARVELLRGLEFDRAVPVEVVSREEYRRRRSGNQSAASRAWTDQVWEALFVVGEDRDATEAVRTVFATSVVGFYASGDDRIVLVSDNATPKVDRSTLVHELVHALQDQRLNLGRNPPTRDARMAENGVIEGDANVVQAAYERRCGDEWDCLPRPERTRADTPAGFDRGVFTVVFLPYSRGPGLVRSVRERRGWEGVNGMYRRFPASTEQVIHPETYPHERPVRVRVADRSSGGWERFALDRPEYDTLGEAAVYAMLWANGLTNGSRYGYVDPASAGWGGDRLVPYRKQTATGTRYGYVWKTVWDSPADAREFAAAYRNLLGRHGARRETPGVFVVPGDDPFADAFRVTRRGRAVVIVNAPTVGELDGVRAPR